MQVLNAELTVDDHWGDGFHAYAFDETPRVGDKSQEKYGEIGASTETGKTAQDQPPAPLLTVATDLPFRHRIQAERLHRGNRIGARSPNTADILAGGRQRLRGVDFWVLDHPAVVVQQNGAVEDHLSI